MSASLLFLFSATKEWMLYLFAVIFGCFGYGISAIQMPLAAAFFGIHAIGLIFGVISLGFTIGAATGAFVTGYIFDVTSTYQGAFVVLAVVAILSVTLMALLKPIKAS